MSSNAPNRGNEVGVGLGPAGGGGAGVAGLAEVTETLYGELRAIAGRMFASERSGHTLQPTAVVNEACLRLARHPLPALPREQQLAIAGRVLRQVLIDHARTVGAQKRGGGRGGALRVELEAVMADGDAAMGAGGAAEARTVVELERVNLALERLASLSPRQAQVVTLRLFSGLPMEQVAEAVGVSKRAAEGDWMVARAWLRRELAEGEDVENGGAAS